MVFCYCLKYSSNDYSYLKQSPFSIFACQHFVQKCDILLGWSKICDSLWQGRGGQKSSKIAWHTLWTAPYYTSMSAIILGGTIVLILLNKWKWKWKEILDKLNNNIPVRHMVVAGPKLSLFSKLSPLNKDISSCVEVLKQLLPIINIVL